MNVRIDLPSGAISYLHWWHRAARADDPQAQALLAALYADGDEVPQAPEASFYWHLKAAENGNVDSQVIVAGYYADGWADFPSDIEEAEKWYERASEAGSAEAKFELASIRFVRVETEEDRNAPAVDAIFSLYQDAAFGGHSLAPIMVSGLFFLGAGTVEDLPFAYAWAKLSMVRKYGYGRESFIQVSREIGAEEAQLGERLFESLKQQVPVAATIYEV